ncbi:hypothetical protein OK074_9074 [Actinobacteria bacterium OK074]|nr:hypothetical protein OK074_9074 [Actinobacteria bacterium OK074]
MNQYDPSATPAPPPGMPAPGPDPGHLLARRGVQWTIISVIVSTLLTLLGFYLQGRHSDDAGSAKSSTSGGTSLTGGATSGVANPGSPDPTTPDPAPTPPTPDDGLTTAERSLRDSLNTDQWQPGSCAHEADAAAVAVLRCTVVTKDATGAKRAGKASIARYAKTSEVQEIYRRATSNLPDGNCDTTQNVRGTWVNAKTGITGGDTACLWDDTLAQYDIFWTYYDQPVIVEIQGPNAADLTAWWHTFNPVLAN